MKKQVKWIIWGLAAAAVIAGSAYYALQPLALSVTEVTPQIAEVYFTEQGVAGVERTVSVYAALPGAIKELPVAENQTVKQGDVLCVIDTADLAYQMAQTESSIRGYQAQMDNLDAEEDKARDSLQTNRDSLLGELRALEAQQSASDISAAGQLRLTNIIIAQNERDLARAKDDADKAAALYAAGDLSRQAYEQALAAVQTQENLLQSNLQQRQMIENGELESNDAYFRGAKASLQAQIAGIDKTLSQSYTGAMKDYYAALIEGGQAAMAQLRQKMEDGSVRATVSGVVTKLYVKDANMVSGQTPVADIVPDITSRVEVYVSTGDIDEVYTGQPVELILKRRSGDKTLTGRVEDIGEEAEARLNVLGVEERRVKVSVLPDEDGEELKKGYDVDVRFVIYREENRLIVPKTALFEADGKDYVWVLRNGKAAMAEVAKGRELRAAFIVENGLVAGDAVITDANEDVLREGVRVKAA